MALPAHALLHRLQGHASAPWAAYMPARFRECAGAGASSLGQALLASRGARTAAPAGVELGSLVSQGGRAGNVAGRVWRLSSDARGCREVQQALEEASDEERRGFVEELHGYVQEASRCPHANYVMQKCITTMAPKSLQFVIDELMEKDSLIAIAQHKYGCRIVQRLVEHCPPDQVHDLIQALLDEFMRVSQHAFGSFVVQKLLQHVVQEQRTRLVGLVEQHVSELASNQHGCAVLGAALEYGDLTDRCRLADMVLEEGAVVTLMVGTKHGHVIIANLLDALDGPGCQRLAVLLETNPKLEEVLQRRSEEGSSECC